MNTRDFLQQSTNALQAKLRAAAAAEAEVPIAEVSAEEFLESADYCDIAITDGQRALTRLAEGLPITHLDPFDLEYFCGARILPDPTCKPRTVVGQAGRRSGKTLLADMLALVRSALVLPLRREPKPGERAERDGKVGVRKGEPVRGLVVAPRLKQSAVTFGLLCAILVESPKLKHYVVGDPGVTSVTLRRDDGQEVTIEVLAAAPKGTNLRGGWFIGIVFDEADFFGEQDANVTLEDQIDAVKPALLPGAQMWLISSPWDESGYFYQEFKAAFGKPGDTVAFHASSQRLNPMHCNSEQIELDRKKKPEYVAREFDAIPMPSGTDQFFPENLILACCTRIEPLQLAANGAPHYGGCDPGLRKNSAALALARQEAGKAVLARYLEFIPQKKSEEQTEEDRKKGIPPGLAPSWVFRSFAEVSLEYGAFKVQGDQYYEDSAIEEMPKTKNERGDSVYYDTVVDNAESTSKLLTDLRNLMAEGKAVMPRDEKLMQQLRDTKARRGQGKVIVSLPRSAAAHGDVLKAVALAMVQVPITEAANDDGWNRQKAGALPPQRWHRIGGRGR